MYLMVRSRRGWTRGIVCSDLDSVDVIVIATVGGAVVILVDKDGKGRYTRWQFVYWHDHVLLPSWWVILAFHHRRLRESRAGRVHHYLYVMDRVDGLYDLRHHEPRNRIDVPDRCLQTTAVASVDALQVNIS